MSELPLALSLYADLDLGKLVSADGNTLVLPDAKLGDTWLCKLRFLLHAEDGVRERLLNVRSVRSSLGKVMTAPTSGTFKLRRVAVAAVPALWSSPADPLVTLTQVVVYTGPADTLAFEAIRMIAGSDADAWAEELNDHLSAYLVATVVDGDLVLTGVTALYSFGITYTSVAIPLGTTAFAFYTPAVTQADTAAINFDQSAASIETILEAVTPAIAEVKKPADGVWLYRLTDDSHFDLTQGVNRLDPISMVRLRAFQGAANEWWHEVRLIQAPLAFSSAHDRVLPPPPSITQIQDGRAETDLDPPRNEVQALYLPPDFRGTYIVEWDGRRSKVIGIADEPDDIATALNGMYSDGETRFEVTNPVDNYAYFEFIGDLAATSQALATVSVDTCEPGVVTFALPLNRAEMASALRAVAELTVPLEVEVKYVGDDEDPMDEDVESRTLTLFQQDVKIVREQIYEELGVEEPTNWLHPNSPRTYLPFNGSQLLVGNRETYIESIGDGSTKTFVITHNRATKNGTFSIRENASPFAQMNPRDGSGLLYTVNFTSNDVITVVWDAARTAPTLNQYVVMFEASGTASAFQADLHIAIAQVDDLTAALAAVTSRLDALEAFIPTAAPSVSDPDSVALERPIPNKFEAFPGKFVDAFAVTPTAPKRARPLLKAFHKASGSIAASDTVYPPLPTAETLANVVVQNVGEDIFLPGSFGQPSATVLENGYFGSDGRVIYPLTKDGSTNSFYPTAFERRLFVISVNDKMLRAGSTLTVTFDLAAQLLAANTAAQWMLLIDVGTVPQASSPSPVGVNLSDVVWSATPILKQRIVLSSLSETGAFGASVSRSASSAYTASALLYTEWEAANSGAPASANFLLRARLAEFDVEDALVDAVGAVWYGLTNGTWKISKN